MDFFSIGSLSSFGIEFVDGEFYFVGELKSLNVYKKEEICEPPF